MIPDNKVSVYAPLGEFLSPDNVQRCNLLRDMEFGSLELENPEGGLRQAIWECWSERQYLKIRRLATETLPAGNAISVQFVTGNITEVSLAFDSSMRVHIAYVEDSVAKLYWYNPVSQLNEIRVFEDASASPRLCLDDKRSLESTTRDILLFYLKNGGLCFRQQRDRYEIEYYLYPTTAVKLGQVGMATTNRVQIELIYSELCGDEGNFLVFEPILNAFRNTYYYSEVVTSDICIMPRSVISITGGEYRLNLGDWTTENGLVIPTDTIQLRLKTTGVFETKHDAVVTVSWYSGTFSVTTGENTCIPELYKGLPFLEAGASFADQDEYIRPLGKVANAEFPAICE